MDNVLDSYEQETKIRPTFLTVLCILTFIGSGFGLISNSMGYFQADKTAAEMVTAKNEMAKDLSGKDGKFQNQMMDSLSSAFTPDNLRKSALGGLATSILCLIGAVMMWQLKRTGYYIYIVGALIGMAIPFLIFGTGNIFAIGMSVFTGFFGLLFIVLYGLNLKSLR